MRRVIVLLLAALAVAPLAIAHDLAGDWIATVMELPGMNHLLQDARTGAPDEYNDIEETMSPAAVKIIADWLSLNVLTRHRARTGA